MTNDNPADSVNGTTRFAPPVRKPKEETVLHFNRIARNPVARQLLDAVPQACILLNRERQIVFANRAMARLLGAADPLSLCGLRPGEALNCVHAGERLEGCGTTQFCRMCGAVNAILESHAGYPATQECRITRGGCDALDLRVAAETVTMGEQEYTLFTAADISHEKRRQALERIFFHDIINTAGALHGLSELMADNSKNMERRARNMRLLSKRLLEEIAAQRELLAAESNDLRVDVRFIRAVGLIEEVIGQHEERMRGKVSLRIDPAARNITFKSDPVLLGRVLGNFLKNAVEASKEGDVITLGADLTPEGVEFWIHNPAAMPEEVQLQIFQRSFSTKGAGRGLGTYSAKLITERYLKGRISFVSSAEAGTTFRAVYPVDLS